MFRSKAYCFLLVLIVAYLDAVVAATPSSSARASSTPKRSSSAVSSGSSSASRSAVSTSTPNPFTTSTTATSTGSTTPSSTTNTSQSSSAVVSSSTRTSPTSPTSTVTSTGSTSATSRSSSAVSSSSRPVPTRTNPSISSSSGSATSTTSTSSSGSSSSSTTSSSTTSSGAAGLVTTSEVVSSGTVTITPVFQETTFSQYTDLSTTLTTSTRESNGHIVPFIIWPHGLGWTCILFCGGGGGGGPPFGGDIPFPTDPPKDPNNKPSGTNTNPTQTQTSATSQTSTSQSSSSSSSSSTSSGSMPVLYPAGIRDAFSYVTSGAFVASILSEIQASLSVMDSGGSSSFVTSRASSSRVASGTPAKPSSGVSTSTPTSTTAPGSTTTQVSSSSSSTPSSTPTPTTTPKASSAPAPICSEGNNSLMGVNNEPASWCFCAGRGPFATIPQATTSYCVFSALPTQTISLTSISTSVNSACSLTTAPYTAPGAQPTTLTLCKCGEEELGLATTTSGSVVLAGCELSSTWSIMSTISTIVPVAASTTTSAPPVYNTGTCDLHIFEASQSYNSPLFVQFNISDGANDPLVSKNFQLKWGDSATVMTTDSRLPYDINVDFLQKTSVSKMAKRMVGPPPPPIPVKWEDWVLTIAAGSTSWDDTHTDTSTLPYCKVGAWDNGNFWDWLDSVVSLGAEEHIPNRQMDCHWAC